MLLPLVVDYYTSLVLKLLVSLPLLGFLALGLSQVRKKYQLSDIPERSSEAAKTHHRASSSSVQRMRQQRLVWNVDFGMWYSVIYSITLVIFNITNLFNLASSFQSGLHCRFLVFIPSLVRLSRGLIYLLFVLRIHMTYADTLFEVPKRKLVIIGGCCTLATLVLCVAYVILIEASSHRIGTFGKLCFLNVSPLVVVPASLLDVTMMIWSLHQFVRPLLSLADTTDNFQILAVKYTIVSWTQIITTFLFLVSVAVLGQPTFGSIDLVMTAMCLALMTKWIPEKTYRSLCCGSIWCASNICGSCCHQLSNPDIVLSSPRPGLSDNRSATATPIGDSNTNSSNFDGKRNHFSIASASITAMLGRVNENKY